MSAVDFGTSIEWTWVLLTRDWTSLTSGMWDLIHSGIFEPWDNQGNVLPQGDNRTLIGVSKQFDTELIGSPMAAKGEARLREELRQLTGCESPCESLMTQCQPPAGHPTRPLEVIAPRT